MFLSHFQCPGCAHQWDELQVEVAALGCPECGVANVLPSDVMLHPTDEAGDVGEADAGGEIQ